MKKILILLLIAIVAIGANARTFTILELNTPVINIGGVDLKVGDTFDHRKHISWKSARQAMRVRTDNNKVLVISPTLFAKYKAKEFSDFLAIVEPMITRAGSTPLTEDEHRRVFEGDHVLLDSLTFDVGWKMDDSSFFYATFTDTKGQEYKVPLAYEGHTVIIPRQLFEDIPVKDDSVAITIHYHESEPDEDTVITDAMNVIIVPASID